MADKLRGGSTVGGNLIWHAGNDGDGSGLDADLLDGIQSTGFVQRNGIITTGDLNTYQTTGVWSVEATILTNMPYPNHGQLVVVKEGNKAYQQYTCDTVAGGTWTRRMQVNTWLAWERNVMAADVNYAALQGTVPTWNQNTTGNAATATKLQTTRTISLSGDSTGSVLFDGSGNANIVVTRSTANMLADILAIDGSGSGIDADLLDGYHGTALATVNTYALRDSAADINARLFRSNYADQSTISGGLAFRINNSTDNYIRTCNSPAAVRVWLDTNNATNLTSGTVPDARISGSYTGLTNLTGTGTVDFGKFLGNAADTVALPSFSWTGDDNTGIYSPAADNLAITTGGVQRALFNASGITGSLVGNASTASTLQTARTINGVSFNGSANIEIEIADSRTIVEW